MEPRKQREPSGKPYDSSFLSPDEIESLSSERLVLDENETQQATRLLREHAPEAALSIIHLAKFSETPSVRLNASKYILDKVMGRDALFEKTDPVTEFLKKIQSEK
jgi:hypothetical protein